MPRNAVDRESPEYKRAVLFYIVLVTVLGVLGGSLLGLKIAKAEAHGAARQDEPRLLKRTPAQKAQLAKKTAAKTPTDAAGR